MRDIGLWFSFFAISLSVLLLEECRNQRMSWKAFLYFCFIERWWQIGNISSLIISLEFAREKSLDPVHKYVTIQVICFSL